MYVNKLVEQRLVFLRNQRTNLAMQINSSEELLKELNGDYQNVKSEIEELEKHLNENS